MRIYFQSSIYYLLKYAAPAQLEMDQRVVARLHFTKVTKSAMRLQTPTTRALQVRTKKILMSQNTTESRCSEAVC